MREFIPAFRFLGVFLGLYLGLNLVYGLWISSYQGSADWATRIVTEQTSFVVNLLGEQTSTQPKIASPTISIMKDSQSVISVFEGCNGINVMIVFVSFLFAFRGKSETTRLVFANGHRHNLFCKSAAGRCALLCGRVLATVFLLRAQILIYSNYLPHCVCALVVVDGKGKRIFG
jgi:exosortase family protein XrtF